MANVDSILNFDPKTEDDFYAILGCDENSTPEQINAEYKVRALLLHPDKNAGDKEAEAKFQKLQMAKETLLDHEKRSNYDKWRHCGMSVSYQQWLGVKEHVHQSMHWSTLKTKDRMLPGNSSEASGAKPADLPPAALRRASEGGANIQWGPKGTLPWNSKPPSDVVSKFRNYEI
ncbi:J domain-containing protein [Frankliniella occidentalis]|uniref:J domain-containing protein n=1 Tax=Frankliniella occidentalis TaxID=133901 RepID=A0A6J1S7I7_FRAOC|nr:J domain-containing protein [Frankliniella occidentalis]